jgi:lipid-binding SYLF domain-containing protein
MFANITKISAFSIAGMATLMLLAAGCSTEPTSNNGRNELNDNVQASMQRLNLEDTGLQSFLNNAYGYAVFPSIGKGGLIAGGAYGRGEVFEQGRFVGYADLSQATIGAQIGGQKFSEVIAFKDQRALSRFESGQFAFDANASAVALKSGAAASAKYANGVAVFVEPIAGLMVEASVGGQSFSFQPSNWNQQQ